jgi:tRNA nucleotidyltransferase/poly(A) polymerase
MLLNRPIADLDFALPKDASIAAKRVADQLGGGFFVLDQERETCRVILIDDEDQRLVVDFTLFQGDTIEEDLASRDFTITSMALDLEQDANLIDPFNGVQDLRDGLIRATSAGALEADSLRCLRAVRLAAQLGFYILPETRQQIARFHHNLGRISPERKRDELLRILAGPNQSAALLSLQKLDLYNYLLPGEFSLQFSRWINNLESLWSLFLEVHDQERAGNWSKGLLVHRLGRYREQINRFLSLELVPGRSQYQLTFLIPLLADLSPLNPPVTFRERIEQVSLSNQEAKFIDQGIQALVECQSLSPVDVINQPVAVYRFYGQYGSAGVAAIFLCLANQLEEQLGISEQEHWITQLDLARYLLEGYWERYQEWVDPPPLLNGDEIQQELDLPPGPEIGHLLGALREEQVRSGLASKKAGVKFLKERLPAIDERDR